MAIELPHPPVDIDPEGLSIGEVSRLVGLSIEALRYYEREGLMLDPTPRNASGRRRYGSGDLSWIAGLLMLRETGMSISDMRQLAELSRREGTEAERLIVLEDHRDRVLDELARTRGHLAALEKKITAYRNALGSDPSRADEEGRETP